MLSRKAAPSRIPKLFTPDHAVPTIEAAESAGERLLRVARKVDGSFTYVKPERRTAHELKWVSPSALSDALGTPTPASSAFADPEFADVVAGQTVVVDEKSGIYPFATNYAGDQFGSWAGQLGDGRAITLFRLGAYEVQLKGAGLTPYSRFADGLAVVRSSIREALASEYLHAIGIPTQRVLALSVLPRTAARREQIERCAIVARMAESYVRLGTFQLHHARQNRSELRALANYCIELLGITPSSDPSDENRYFLLFRESSLRNARMIAKCQAYGFLNGVLNTDNVSILGLSIDYGPFAFMDTFDPNYTPNHDDHMGRYGFKNAPMAMWWNCIKLGETLGELIGQGRNVDNPEFVELGTQTEKDQEHVAEHATKLIMGVGKEFQATYESEYLHHILTRIGITVAATDGSDDALVESMLKMMRECEVDYNLFFRKLARENTDPTMFMPASRTRVNILSDKEALEMISAWLAKYRSRLESDTSVSQEERANRMLAVNPKFLLRNSVLANVIDLAEKGNWDAFDAVAEMALSPFKEKWVGVDELYAKRYNREPLAEDRDSQLSCSS